MRSDQRLRWGTAGVLGAALVLLWQCARRDDAPAVSSGSEAAAQGAETVPAVGPAAEPAAEDDDRAAALPRPVPARLTRDPALSSSDAGAPQESAVGRAMRTTSEPDRALLADIERATRAAPPPAIHTLLAMGKRGESAAALERFITSELGSDLRLRAAAMRWLRSTHPETRQTVAPAPEPSGTGSAPRRVAPFEPKP